MTPEQMMTILCEAFGRYADTTGEYVEPLFEPIGPHWSELVIDGTFDMLEIAKLVLTALPA